MFNKELKFISDLNLNKLQDLGSKFTLQEIKNSRIHPSLYKYIDAAIELEILQDRLKMQSGSKFDYSGDRINNYFSLITKEIKRVKKFNYSYASTLLQKAIVFNANYLTRPNHTLVQFVYSDDSVRTIDELLAYLAHSYYYRYLQKILLTYFDKKKILKLSREEFASLLVRVDSISRNTHLYDTLDTAVNSMANFFDPSLNTSERVPLEAVRLYLKEKRLNEFLDKFNNKFGFENNSLQLASEIQSVLKAVIPEEEIELEIAPKSDEDEFVPTEDSNTQEQTEVGKQEEKHEEKKSEEEIVDSEIEIEAKEIEVKDFKEPEKVVIEHPEQVLDSEDDYHVIENQDILSEAHLTDQTKQVNENLEDNSFIENDEAEITTSLPEENELVENVEENKHETIEDKSDTIKETREKPNTKGLLRKLIDLFPIYDSLISKPKPFEDSEVMTKIDAELFDSEYDDTKYQMDISTLQDELIVEDESPMIDEIPEEEKDVQVSSKEYDEYMGSNSILEDGKTLSIDSSNLEIGEKIDEIVADEKNEEEFINQITDTAEVNIDIEEVQEIPEVMDDEKLKLLNDEDKEITEVFTDLSFLDKSDDVIVESDDFDTNFEMEKKESESENNSYNEDDDYMESGNVTVVYSSFKEMLKDRDMTSIIEAIFDYDMEDYLGVIDNINNSSNQNEAIEITEKYLVENHIDLNLKDVIELKKIISNYFSKTTT